MRKVVVGLGVGVGLSLVIAGWNVQQPLAFGQRVAEMDWQRNGVSLIALNGSSSDGSQQVTLVDPAQRVMGVYHVDSATGAITLRSVRNIRWDLMLDDFNGKEPFPHEIRALANHNSRLPLADR